MIALLCVGSINRAWKWLGRASPTLKGNWHEPAIAIAAAIVAIAASRQRDEENGRGSRLREADRVVSSAKGAPRLIQRRKDVLLSTSLLGASDECEDLASVRQSRGLDCIPGISRADAHFSREPSIELLSVAARTAARHFRFRCYR